MRNEAGEGDKEDKAQQQTENKTLRSVWAQKNYTECWGFPEKLCVATKWKAPVWVIFCSDWCYKSTFQIKSIQKGFGAQRLRAWRHAGPAHHNVAPSVLHCPARHNTQTSTSTVWKQCGVKMHREQLEMKRQSLGNALSNQLLLGEFTTLWVSYFCCEKWAIARWNIDLRKKKITFKQVVHPDLRLGST